jgi:hypothetical protein
MSDILVQAAGVLAIAVALLHEYLGETKFFAKVPIAPARAQRLARAVWLCSTVAWIAFGALLILVPMMDSHMARISIIAASVVVYASGAIGNAWATRGRHYGWAVLSVVIGLAVAGL